PWKRSHTDHASVYAGRHGDDPWQAGQGLILGGRSIAADAARPRRRGDRMNRRQFITLLGGAAVAWPLTVGAQQPAMPLVGVMSPLSIATAARNIAALRNRLRELGYTEGHNINIEYRFGDGLAERFPVLVADLVALKPAVIVVGSTAGI